jgi:predicted nucleic acid-binding protein
MIVLDASAVVDLLVKPAAETSELRARIRRAGIVYAPHLMDAEVTGATLVTRGARLAPASRHRARVELV